MIELILDAYPAMTTGKRKLHHPDEKVVELIYANTKDCHRRKWTGVSLETEQSTRLLI
jgi:hypothetical protein